MIVRKGEVRQIGIEVLNKLEQSFEIDAAEYSIQNISGSVSESGFPTIDGHKLYMLFDGTHIGRHYVVFKYHVGPEILKAKIIVDVKL